jgi:HSP20 family protein
MFNLIPWRKKDNGGVALRRDADPISRLRSEFDTLFDLFTSHWPAPFHRGFGSDFWGLELDDKENEVVIRAEAPGFEASDFDVHISGNTLVIQAEKKHELKEKRGDGAREEHGFAKFRRMIDLPAGIVPDNVDAKYHRGVLELHIAKSEEAKPKRISVKG